MIYYLASPFSDPDPKVREQRYLQTIEAVEILRQKGVYVYSPIIHWYEVSKRYNLDYDFETWRELNHEIIDKLDGIIVLCINGWKESKGVYDEINKLRRYNKRHSLYKPKELMYMNLYKYEDKIDFILTNTR